MTTLNRSIGLALIVATAPLTAARAETAPKSSVSAPTTPRVENARIFGWDSRPPETTKAPAPETPGLHEATVISTIEARGFNTVYIELESSGKKFWIASRLTNVRVGGRVRFSPESVVAMENFESKALHRTFDKIYFVPTIVVAK